MHPVNSSRPGRFVFVLALGVLSLALAATTAEAQASSQVESTVPFVAIEQSGQVMPITNGTVTLERAPFTFVFTMRSGTSVQARVSRTSQVFDIARLGQPLASPFGYGGGMAEGLRNGDEELFLVDSDGPAFHFWYYSTPSDHRFDSVQIHPNGLVARRTVSRVSAPGERGEGPRYLGTLPDHQLYVVVRLVDSTGHELDRAAIQIVFRDEALPLASVTSTDAVARVGHRVVTAGAFRDLLVRLALARRTSDGKAVAGAALRAEGVHVVALQRLIDVEAALVEAERLGIRVTPAQVEAHVRSLPAFQDKGRYIGDRRLSELLAAQRPAMTREEFLEAARTSAVESALVARMPGKTPEEKASAYRAHLDAAIADLRVTILPSLIDQVVAEVTSGLVDPVAAVRLP